MPSDRIKGSRYLELADQHERSAIGEVEGALQRGEDAEQSYPQPVDGAGAIGGEVGAVGGQHAQFSDDGLVQAQLAQVATRAGPGSPDRPLLCRAQKPESLRPTSFWDRTTPS